MEEEFAPGQDVKHLHEHAQHHRLLSPPGAVHPRYSQYAPNEGHVTPSPLHEDSVGPALVVMHRHYEATLGGQGQEPPRLPLKRRALTYGHWAVDLLGYGVKVNK